MFKQWWHEKKFKNILLVLLQNPSLRRDGYNVATDGMIAIGESLDDSIYSMVGEGVGEVTWTNK